MKKLLLTIAAAIFLAGTGVQAQSQTGDFLLGGGLGYHFDLDDDEIGIVLDGVYSFQDDIRLGVNVFYYLIDDIEFMGETISITAFDVNINGHYLFKNEEDMRLYGLAGINSFRLKESWEGESESDDETGFNLGAGIEYDLTSIMLFGELKLTTGDVHDNNFLFHGGVRYRF